MRERLSFLARVFEGREVWGTCHLPRAPGIKTQEPVELPKPTSFCERMWGWLLGSGTFFQVFKTSGWLLHPGFLERQYLAGYKSFIYHYLKC